MTDTLKTAAAVTTATRAHISNVLLALEEFRLLGINSHGILMNPSAQLSDLRVAHEELGKAITIMQSTDWPSEADYNAF